MSYLILQIVCWDIIDGSMSTLQNLVLFIGITFLIIVSTDYPSREFVVNLIKLIKKVRKQEKTVKELKRQLGE